MCRRRKYCSPAPRQQNVEIKGSNSKLQHPEGGPSLKPKHLVRPPSLLGIRCLELGSRGIFRPQPKTKSADPRGPAPCKTKLNRNPRQPFFSSFLGWHFSQTLPSAAAFLQHSCSHFLPASTVASQQGLESFFSSSARARFASPSMAKAQTTALSVVIFFMSFPFFGFG